MKYLLMKYLLMLLLFALPLYGQNYMSGQDVSDSDGNYFDTSEDDSVFFDDDTLYICGADTAYILIYAGDTEGLTAFKGTVTTKDTMTHAADSARVVFDMAIYAGLTYSAVDANFTNTFYALDSVEIASAGSGTFNFKPFDNSNLDQEYTLYWLLRIRQRFDTNLAAIYLRQEKTRP